MFRWHVVSAVFWRNVKQFFSGPLGYLFLVNFVTICAVMAFSHQFFADNLATLDQLSRWFPMLLLFFVPTVTMSVWAEEKRQGTDSILFTLPASDLDILLGKFLSVVAVYTVALLFSMTQIVVLEILGNPDWGVLVATYTGYWLAGVALLAVGMFASSVTSSATFAFVTGALLCSLPVLGGQYFRGFYIERFGFDWNLHDFTLGLIPLGNVAYFVALTIFMLYLNLIVLSRRHWNRAQQISLGLQYFVRTTALAVILIAGVFLGNTAVSSRWTRLDLTAESLFTLDQATLDTLGKIKADEREVTIQAFVSNQVPRKFVNAKKQLVGLLRQFSEYGGKNINLRFVEVEPASEAAIEARNAGISPQDDRSEVGGRFVEQEVFLGATFSSSLGDAVLPLIDGDSSIEYELSRALATTVDPGRQITLGILDTDAYFAGPILDERRIPWCYATTNDELKKLFAIKHIAPDTLGLYLDRENKTASDGDAPKPKTKPDVLLVAAPSSLDDLAMANLVQYVQAGNPTILLTDPMPFYWIYRNPEGLGVINAPRQARVSNRASLAQFLSSSILPKSDGGTASKILRAIGVEWDNGSAAWGMDNPHPNFSGEIPEYLGSHWPAGYGPFENAFVYARNHDEFKGLGSDDLISNGLSEVLMFYPGSIKKSVESEFDFTPLVSIGRQSGITSWEALTKTPIRETQVVDRQTGRVTIEKEPERSQVTEVDLVVLEPSPATALDDQEHILAARITGTDSSPIDVVIIADLDFVSDVFYIQQESIGRKLDNLALLQNAIDVLAGNESFVSLRNRRATPRTLEKLETIIQAFRSAGTQKQHAAEKEMRAELKSEQEKLNLASQEIESNESLGFFEKLQRTSQEASDAQRRFDLKKKRLDRKLKQEIDRFDAIERKQIARLEAITRYVSIFTAPLPALFLGVVVLWFRKMNEEKDIAADRRV